MNPVPVFCSNGQCGERLGTVMLSGVQSRPRAVWRIEPGWRFSDTNHLHLGVLERTDHSFRSEREVYQHLTGRAQPTQRIGVDREVDLPVVVRCPKCRRTRWVAPDAVFALAR